MSANHVIWESVAGSKFCTVGTVAGVPEEYEITWGISRANGFPADARFHMSKRFPKQVALPDSLVNGGAMIVVSTPLKDLITARSPRSVELLPVAIINHKGRDSGAQYWIVNPLVIVDCIDKAASELDWNVINPSRISGCYKLVLAPAAIPEDLLLFRPKHLEPAVVVRRDLADAIVSGGFTGLSFTEIQKYVE